LPLRGTEPQAPWSWQTYWYRGWTTWHTSHARGNRPC
jgi:hypothetical protein